MEQNLRNLDYGKAMKDLLNQTFSMRRYKEMKKGYDIALRCVTWPLLLFLLVVYVAYSVTYFIFRLFNSPIEYLTHVLHKEGENVKHATQFIIYFIGFPLIFFLQAFSAFLSIFLFVDFFFAHFICLLYSLDGIDHKPYLNDQVERKEVPAMQDPNFTGLIDVIIMYALIVFGIIFEILNAVLAQEGMSFAFAPNGIFIVIAWLFGLLFMGFEKKPAQWILKRRAVKAALKEAEGAKTEESSKEEPAKEEEAVTPEVVDTPNEENKE